MNRILLAVIVAAAVLAGVFYLRGGDEHRIAAAESVKAAAAKAPGSPSPEVVLTIKPGTQAPKAPVSAPKLSPLMQELTTGYGKPLYDRLSQKTSRTPEENYVLARLMELCTEVPGTPRPKVASNSDEARQAFTASVSEKDPDRAKRLAAFDRLETAVRADRPDLARQWAEELAAFGAAVDARWALAAASFGRAQLGDGDVAGEFEAAIEHADTAGHRFDRQVVVVGTRRLVRVGERIPVPSEAHHPHVHLPATTHSRDVAAAGAIEEGAAALGQLRLDVER